MNLRLMLAESADKYGGRIAVTIGDRHISYAQLEADSNRVANALLGMGVNKGDRVAILLPNGAEFATIYLGIVKVGGVAVLLDTKYKPAELTALFADCQPRVLFADVSLVELISQAWSEWGSVARVVAVGDGDRGGLPDYEVVLSGSPVAPVEVPISAEDAAHIAYTSGPTLQPRGVVLTHGGLVAEVAIAAGGFQQTDNDVVVLFALPLHHAFGLVVILLTSLYVGSRVLMLSGLSIGNLMELIEREQATMFMAVPFVYGLIVNFIEETRTRHDISSLRVCGSAGAALPADVMAKFQERYGLTIVDFWGMTESTAHVTCQSLDGSLKPGSVGHTLPGWELKVVDSDGRELSPRQPGEVIVKGPVMKGYYQCPEVTAKVLKEGWLYTGDMGWLDEDGELYLTGIKRDMIIAKGQNIFPSDIEMTLCTHPGVAEAVVVGVRDEARGQIVKAVVRLKPGAAATENELKKLCLQRLANYKVPKQIVFTDVMPRTADGEIDKDALR